MFVAGADNNLTRLLAGRFWDAGPRSVGQYRVVGWRVESGPMLSKALPQQQAEYSIGNIENIDIYRYWLLFIHFFKF